MAPLSFASYNSDTDIERATLMTEIAEKLFREALGLPAAERAALIEELMSSLDKPDLELDKLWAKEAEDRLRAYRSGDLEAVPAEEVFRELGRS
jgi:putative addiction module component (TIGR02574 family)